MQKSKIKKLRKTSVRKSKKTGKSKRIRRPKKKELTGKEKKHALDLQALEELIDRGRGRGFVTDTEVLHFFPRIEEDVSFLEEIYDRLDKVNIKIIKTSQLIEMPGEEISAKELAEATRIGGG